MLFILQVSILSEQLRVYLLKNGLLGDFKGVCPLVGLGLFHIYIFDGLSKTTGNTTSSVSRRGKIQISCIFTFNNTFASLKKATTTIRQQYQLSESQENQKSAHVPNLLKSTRCSKSAQRHTSSFEPAQKSFSTIF